MKGSSWAARERNDKRGMEERGRERDKGRGQNNKRRYEIQGMIHTSKNIPRLNQSLLCVYVC